MEIKQLITFYTVARESSFSQAAQLLNYAQPTVTTHIQSLEVELGGPLFNRMSSGISLTTAGERLLTYAEQMIRIEGEARTVVTQSLNDADGDVSICVSGSIMSYHLPPVIQRLRQDYPKIGIRLVPSLHCDIVQVVSQGEADFGMAYRQSLPTSIEYIKLTDEPLILCAGTQHPLASEPLIEPHHLENQTMLMFSQTCPFREMIDEIFEAHHLTGSNEFEFFEYDSIKQYLGMNMGLAIVPRKVVQTEIERGELVELKWFASELAIPIWIIWNRKKWFSPAMQVFRELVVEIIGHNLSLQLPA